MKLNWNFQSSGGFKPNKELFQKEIVLFPERLECRESLDRPGFEKFPRRSWGEGEYHGLRPGLTALPFPKTQLH